METLKRLSGDDVLGGGLLAYVLWRFAGDGRRQLAAAMRCTVDEFVRMVQRIGRLRLTDPAVSEAIGRLEWRMTCALGGAPWRA